MYLCLAFIVFATVFPMVCLYFYPQLTREMISDLRIPRILHYVSLGALGMSLRLHTHPLIWNETYRDLSVLAVAFILCLTYAAVFAIVTNNIEDLETDVISNPDRPLVKGTVDKRQYARAGWVSLVVGVLGALSIKWEMGVGILLVSLGYYLYSCQPFRLKKIPFLAKLLIGCNSLCIAVTGYVLAGGDAMDFPALWAIFIVIPLSLSANFVDLKDIEGDRAMQVKTLPVIWGEQKARNFIAVCTVFNYAMGAWLLGITWVYGLVAVVASTHLFFLYRKPYSEKPIFLIYVAALGSLSVLLFLK